MIDKSELVFQLLAVYLWQARDSLGGVTEQLQTVLERVALVFSGPVKIFHL